MEELEGAVYRINKLVLLYGNDFEHSAMDIIRKELSGSGQNSAEKAQPEGEHNTSSPKLLCKKCGSDRILEYEKGQFEPGYECLKCGYTWKK